MVKIVDQLCEIIEKYYIKDKERYSSWREDEEDLNEYSMEDELEEFLTSNNIEHKIEKEDGFENSGIDTYFIAVAFIDENGKLDLISVYLEDC